MLRKVLVISVPGLLIAGALTTCSVLVAMRDAPEKQGEGPRPRLVATEVVAPTDARVTVTSQGTVTPRTETSLVSEVAGVVTSVSDAFVAGGFFRKGDVLLQIDPSDYEAALMRAEAELAAARATLAQEVARADQAKKDWDSLERSGEPSALVLRRPYVEEARARVQAAEAEVAMARRDLERTTIRAPYDGLMREKAADVGQYVAVGTRLGAAFAVDYAEIRLPLSAGQRSRIELPPASADGTMAGPPVRLSTTTDGVELTWQARIVRSEGVVDPESRMVYLVAQIQDPYRRREGNARNPEPLEIGTFVSAEIQGRTLANVYPVPRAALTADDGLLYVDAEDRLRIRAVDVLWGDRKSAYVRADLEPPVRVVTSALEAPVDGMAVRLEGAGEGADALATESVAQREGGDD